MVILKMPESVPRAGEFFLCHKRFYWSKAANNQRTGQSDALLEADVIDRVHFNKNFQCQQVKVKAVLPESTFSACLAYFFKKKDSVIAIIFVISREQY